MRVMLGALLVLVMTSAAAAERPQPPESFAAVAEAVKASVVSIVLPRPPAYDHEEEGLSEENIVRRLFDALTTLPNRTLGAGVLLQPGVVVTGARILRDRTDLEVVTIDGRHHRARVIGRDDRVEIAVLRVTPSDAFPAARLGNSDEVRVGDWVLAVGSPYGFEASVSAGIVSARARVAANGPYGDMLQTDAAIKIMDDILTPGRVVRSWLGIAPQALTPELARAFRVPVTSGVLLADVVPGGPVANAGVTRGTILTALEGHLLRSLDDLVEAEGPPSPARCSDLSAPALHGHAA
jgi:serine protease Do